MAPRIKLNALYAFYKNLNMKLYNNAQIHPYVTLQYFKQCLSCPESIQKKNSYYGFQQLSAVLSK